MLGHGPLRFAGVKVSTWSFSGRLLLQMPLACPPMPRALTRPRFSPCSFIALYCFSCVPPVFVSGVGCWGLTDLVQNVAAQEACLPPLVAAGSQQKRNAVHKLPLHGAGLPHGAHELFSQHYGNSANTTVEERSVACEGTMDESASGHQMATQQRSQQFY